MSFPFTYNQSNKKIMFFKPNFNILKTVNLTRKYPLFSSRNFFKLFYIDGINGCEIQASNDTTFSNYKTIHTFKNIHTPQALEIKVNPNEKFKCYRFYSNSKNGYLAELCFKDKLGKALKGVVIKSDKSFGDSLYDENPSTHFGGRNHFIGIKLKVPTEIGSFVFQTRNDANHIIKGNTYELFYWDKEWVSLNKQVATDTIIRLKNKVPQNALLLLKSKGIETHVFVMDASNNQIWIGSKNK